MKPEFAELLEQEFPFMRRSREESSIAYQKYGCECGQGWYPLLRELCRGIADRYAEDGAEVDLVVYQVKEKFGSLRFYYGFEDAPLGLQAIDCLNGGSLRLTPAYTGEDEAVIRRRDDIGRIVKCVEERSKTICEWCGESGCIRTDMPWRKTLCAACYHRYAQTYEQQKNTPKAGKEQFIE